MASYWCLLIYTFLVLSNLDLACGRKGFSRGGHSYPKSGGLSGGGHGGSHGYPSSGGSHSYPSSGGSHGYPSSGGLSGNNRGTSGGYPSTGGSHGYPASGGLSGSGRGSSNGHGYPASGGLSGSNSGYPASKGPSGNTHTSTHTTNVYNYHYNPPQQIRYTPAHGPPVSYPVYRGNPPTYVYQYKDSGSKYSTLLAGLALLNLGALAGTAYASSHRNNNYKPQPGEVCKFGVKKDNGDFEVTKIDCQLITSFIFEEQAKAQNGPTNTTVITTTVTNVTMVNSTNGVHEPPPPLPPVPDNIIYSMLPNGTLVPLNGTSVNGTVNVTNPVSPNNTAASITTSSVTTTTTNTTVTNAIDVKGKPIVVTPEMQCFVMRTTPTSNMKKGIPCGVLQTYADKSIRPNSAARNAPAFTIVAVIAAICLIY